MASVPNFSFILGLTNRQPKLLSCISASLPKGLETFEITHGPRVICSTPPEINRSPSPALMALLAATIADIPDEHKRLIVSPGTENGKPAKRDDMRATFLLSSPA